MNGRRNFVKGFGLLSAVLAGGAAVSAQSSDAVLGSPVVPDPDLTPVSPAIDPSIVSKLEEDSTSLSLTRTYGELAPPEPQPAYDGYFIGNSTGYTEAMRLTASGGLMIGNNNKKFVPGTEKQVNVKMVPGPDGELYLNLNGKWKRVLTA